MSWRIVKISTHCKVSLLKDQFYYEPAGEGEAISFPIEDIAVVILESRQIVITTALLSELADHRVTVMVCDEKHRPNGVLLSYGKPSRSAEVVIKQVGMTKPQKKRLWQRIIEEKILNQANVLQSINKVQAEILKKMAEQVSSGDQQNIEALAAKIYWESVFGKGFVRHQDDGINAGLNYGYAIIRNVIIENIAASGLVPCLGVKHCSILNSFNLADDLIEPYRAFVDRIVIKMKLKAEDNLTKEYKEILISVLQEKCLINGQNMSILNAIEQTVYTFVSVIKNGDITKLQLPRILNDKL